jgi:hypothetical protein
MAGVTRSRISVNDPVYACAICERTILTGEERIRFLQENRARTVCRLCTHEASALGWVREGKPVPPPLRPTQRRPLLSRLLRREARSPQIPPLPERVPPATVATPSADLARATAMLAGVELFNASPYRGTIAGISKSLGAPRIGVVSFGGRRPGIAITIAWELSWYRYVVDPAGTPQVRLDAKGESIEQIDERFRIWNAETDADGYLTLRIDNPADRRP